jgi:hypothetical protein
MPSRDILSNSLVTALVLWLRIAALVVSGTLGIGTEWRAVIWVLALTTMSIGCLVNALLP